MTQPSSPAPLASAFALSPTAALNLFAPSRQFLNEGLRSEQATRYGFRIGDLGLLLRSEVISEMIPRPNPARIPGTPTWMRGVINLRGSLIPVFDLAAIFGGQTSANAASINGLVIDRGEHAAAVLIEGYPTPLSQLSPVDETPPLPAVLLPFVSSTMRQDTQWWIEFDHRRFFSSLAQRMTA